MNITECGQEPTDARLTGITIDHESVTAGFKGNACAILAEALGKQLYDSGAENYIEMRFNSGVYPDGGELVVTLQRCAGKTPHQLRQAAEQQRDVLRAEARQMTEDVYRLTCLNAKLVGFLRELRGLEHEHPQRDRIDQVLGDLIAESETPALTELESLRADKARLDSGRIITWDRDMFGQAHTVERTGLDLRAAIDAARALDAEDQRQPAAV